MRKIFIIGIGAGDPDYLTVQAIRALGELDVVFAFAKGEEKADLLDLRRTICARHVGPSCRFVAVESPDWSSRSNPDYIGVVDDLNARKRALSEELIARELGPSERGGFLVWGDPSLYDSTVRIVEGIAAGGDLDYEVIPGITSVQALTARHRVTLNRIGGDVAITTGRRLAKRLPDAADIVVMLDADGAFRRHLGQDLTIFYGAYLGMADEILIAGPLDAVAEEIVARRGQARARKGWIMDSYLLRRRRA